MMDNTYTISRAVPVDEYNKTEYQEMQLTESKITRSKNKDNQFSTLVIFSKNILLPNDKVFKDGKWFLIKSVDDFSGESLSYYKGYLE